MCLSTLWAAIRRLFVKDTQPSSDKIEAAAEAPKTLAALIADVDMVAKILPDDDETAINSGIGDCYVRSFGRVPIRKRHFLVVDDRCTSHWLTFEKQLPPLPQVPPDTSPLAFAQLSTNLTFDEWMLVLVLLFGILGPPCLMIVRFMQGKSSWCVQRGALLGNRRKPRSTAISFSHIEPAIPVDTHHSIPDSSSACSLLLTVGTSGNFEHQSSTPDQPALPEATTTAEHPTTSLNGPITLATLASFVSELQKHPDLFEIIARGMYAKLMNGQGNQRSEAHRFGEEMMAGMLAALNREETAHTTTSDPTPKPMSEPVQSSTTSEKLDTKEQPLAESKTSNNDTTATASDLAQKETKQPTQTLSDPTYVESTDSDSDGPALTNVPDLPAVAEPVMDPTVAGSRDSASDPDSDSAPKAATQEAPASDAEEEHLPSSPAAEDIDEHSASAGRESDIQFDDEAEVASNPAANVPEDPDLDDDLLALAAGKSSRPLRTTDREQVGNSRDREDAASLPDDLASEGSAFDFTSEEEDQERPAKSEPPNIRTLTVRSGDIEHVLDLFITHGRGPAQLEGWTPLHGLGIDYRSNHGSDPENADDQRPDLAQSLEWLFGQIFRGQLLKLDADPTDEDAGCWSLRLQRVEEPQQDTLIVSARPSFSDAELASPTDQEIEDFQTKYRTLSLRDVEQLELVGPCSAGFLLRVGAFLPGVLRLTMIDVPDVASLLYLINVALLFPYLEEITLEGTCSLSDDDDKQFRAARQQLSSHMNYFRSEKMHRGYGSLPSVVGACDVINDGELNYDSGPLFDHLEVAKRAEAHLKSKLANENKQAADEQ